MRRPFASGTAGAAGAVLAAIASVSGLFAPAPARAAGLFGSDKEVLLWAPPEGFSDWARLDAALTRASDVKLTIALSPSMLTADAKRSMAGWMFAGRVEGALRLDGDPILPLIAEGPAPRPDDVTTRVGEAREAWRVAFGSAPAGLVPGGGAVAPALFDAWRALGVRWAAAGPYSGSTAAWTADGTLALAPFRAASTAGRELSASDLGLAGSGAPGAYVVDEADGLSPPGSLLRLLDGAAPRPSGGWATVSEALKERSGALRRAAKVKEWPTWTGGLEPWTSGAAARRDWSLYAGAAQALDRYQNSDSADLKALDAATAELFAAQASRFYRELPAPEADAAAKAFRQRLLGVYRKLKLTPPDALFADGPGPAAGGDQPTAVRISQGSDSVEFENPAGSFGRAPPGFQLEEGGAPGEAFRVESLRVRSGEEGLSLVFKLGRLDGSAPLDPAPSAAPDLGRVIIETYLDLNHVPGAGATALLFDRGTFVMAKDAWEFALTVSAWGAFLYKANPLGAPQPIGKLAPLVDPAAREVRVTIPRSLLRGNALRWGYTVVTEAADPATARKPPVRPLREGEATAVRGLLGPLEAQKALADAKPGSRPRLTAVRASSD